MIKIGLVGESPHDTKAIKNLLGRHFKENIEFITLVENIHGSQLDNQKTKHFLRKEYESQKPELVIFIRDLDALPTDRKQLKKRKAYFSEFKSVVAKALYLLNIYELEALILADIETFNKMYDCTITCLTNCMLQTEPKEFLQTQHSRYKESDAPEIFAQLNFEVIILNCKYFKTFIKKLNKELAI